MPRTTLNVLVTAASRRVRLLRAFKEALAGLGLRGRVIATDVNPLSPAVHVADRAYRVPLSTEPAYLGEIESIAAAERVSLIVPTIDDELEAFAEARAGFTERGVFVAVSPFETVRICNDKLETCRRLASRGVAAVETFVPGTLPADPPLPAFVKPRTGRGSVSAFPARTRAELDFFAGYVPDPVVQRFLDGPEHTIDLFCDANGRPLSIVPRERLLIRSGVSDRGRTVQDPALIDLALGCAGAFRFLGPVNIQCRTFEGRPTVFEINPRFSGGVPLTIAAGADFPRMLVELALGRPLDPSIGEYDADCWMSSYETAFFFDSSRLACLKTCSERDLGRAEIRLLMQEVV